MDNSAHPQSSQSAPRGSLERADVSFKGVVYFLIGLVISGVLIQFGERMFFRDLESEGKQGDRRVMREHVLPSVAASHTYFPEPREEISPRIDLQALRAQEAAELGSYGWVDKKAGVVRIPIERALELISQRGLPVGAGASNGGPSSLQLQQQRPIQSTPPNKEEGK